MGETVAGFAELYQRERPDILLVIGDRFEMHAAALAAVPFNIPIAHLHGGEVTVGAFDEGLRHSLTKLSHLHFVSNDEYGRRVVQMGEEPWRVTVSGAPALDNLKHMEFASRDELQARYAFPMDRTWLLVTFHPVTLESDKAPEQVRSLLGAVRVAGFPAIITAPNADTCNQSFRRSMEDFASCNPDTIFVENLGVRDYMSAMRYASAMVGNSSSGIVEAPSFGLPVVNVGTRQQGRIRTRNVIDTGYLQAEIEAAIHKAVSPGFRASLAGLENPNGCCNAGERITQRLESVPIDEKLLHKVFHDVRSA
jgi:UDP-hydrolysing UDP-N-acetyl-D-glucosamine 2-epimerase